MARRPERLRGRAGNTALDYRPKTDRPAAGGFREISVRRLEFYCIRLAEGIKFCCMQQKDVHMDIKRVSLPRKIAEL